MKTPTIRPKAVVLPLWSRRMLTPSLWRAACSCQVSGRCPVCLEWHRRLRLRDLVALQIARRA